ncbi:hypothetical protein N8A98_22215 [Devosia neptuniae]|uniref:Uncharacterized protein n=1 Tax=Devosia neptuniae TaxID=191302 RepID=A0ABY6CCC4_9HYPH|nr:hypothetical protein [Devosia neptuniae]UXN69888.1 hypothetical protein N8A98_22215 [Devosia neptuniae]
MLSRFECIQFPPEETEKKKLSFYLAVSRAEEGHEAGVYFSQVLCKCQRMGDPDLSESYYVAMYNVLYNASGSDLDEVTERTKTTVAASAWFHFVSLFSVANAQMKTRMPDLPTAPRDVDVKTIDELVSAFDFLEADEVAEG